MELAQLVLTGLLVIIIFILLDIRYNRGKTINELRKDIIKHTNYITSLLTTNRNLVEECKLLKHLNIEYSDKLSKQDLIQKILILIIKQIEDNLLKYVYTPSSISLDKSKLYNISILPGINGVEVKALGIIKDKTVPPLTISILSLADGIKDINTYSLSILITELNKASYSTLEIIYRGIARNIESNK